MLLIYYEILQTVVHI